MFVSTRVRPKRTAWSVAGSTLAGGLVVAVAVAGCSGSGTQGDHSDADASHTVKGAYQKTISADSVKVSLHGNQAEKSGGKHGSGSQNQHGQQDQHGQPGKQVTGSAVLDFADNASETKIQAPGQSDSTTRMIDNISYQKVPQQQRGQIPGNKPWVKVDLVQLAEQAYGKRAKQMLDTSPVDPAGMLSYLRGVTTVKELGTGTVKGAEVRHYRTTVNLTKAAKGQGLQIAQQLQQLQQQLGKPQLSLQVWLDNQDRVRQLQATLPTAQGAGGTGLVLTEQFYDYDAAVDVQPPPKGQTADLTERILKQRQQQQQQRQQQQDTQGTPR